MDLRDYQKRSISCLYAYLRAKSGNPCVVLPTGSGKTPVIAQVCSDAVGKWSGRVAILAHRRELLEQTREKLQVICPNIRFGVYSAGLGSRDVSANIVLAQIQSVYKRAAELGAFDLILVDEAHRIPPDGEGMYRQFLAEAKLVNPFVRLIGLTATPYRMGSGPICAPENLLNEVCYEVGIRELIVDGFLTNLVSKSGKPGSIADLSDVHTRGGEFVESELQDAMTRDEEVVSNAVAETIEHAEKRRKVLIFTCGMKHANMVLGELIGQGVNQPEIGFIHGETPSEERRALLECFRDPETCLKYLVNINVLTEGFDAPNVDMVSLMRATKSPGLYYQMVGRGLRPMPGKANCLVLDFGENIARHGPIDRVKPKKPKAGTSDGEAPFKVCKACQAVVPAGSLTCPECGEPFPARLDARHGGLASSQEILSRGSTEWYPVEKVTYQVHQKKGADETAPKTLRVEYRVGFYESYSEWICCEHQSGSFPHSKAVVWWKERDTNGKPLPSSAKACWEIAVYGGLRSPTHIQVRKEADPKAFPRIIGYRWPGQEREPGDDETIEYAEEQRQTAIGNADWIKEISPEDVPF